MQSQIQRGKRDICMVVSCLLNQIIQISRVGIFTTDEIKFRLEIARSLSTAKVFYVGMKRIKNGR